MGSVQVRNLVPIRVDRGGTGQETDRPTSLAGWAMTECESSERVTGMAVWWVTATPEAMAMAMAMAAAAVAAAAAMRLGFMTHSFRGVFRL